MFDSLPREEGAQWDALGRMKGKEGMGMPYELHKSCDFVIFGEEFHLVNALHCSAFRYIIAVQIELLQGRELYGMGSHRNEIVTWNAMAEGELSNFTPKRTRFC